MVLETYKKIKEIHKNNQIAIFVPDYKYNLNFLKNISHSDDIEVISNHEPFFSNNKYLNFIVRQCFGIIDFIKAITSKKKGEGWTYHTKIFKEFNRSDTILQIAGISFTENFGTLSAFHWMYTMLVAKYLRKQYYCLPQSLGPSDSKLITLFAKIGLNTVTHIMPRGRVSEKFVNNLHLKHKNVTFIPDLAFSYENPNISDDAKIYMRYNLSNEKRYMAVIFNSHLYFWIGRPIIDLIAKEIDSLVLKHGYTVLLIAHEVNDGDQKDDRYVNRLIYEGCTKKESVIQINEDLRANEVKSLIKICEFTICARFHGMISSLKVGVIPVIIGWADKYFEIMELFNLGHLVIDYHQITQNSLNGKINYVLDNNEELKHQISKNITQFENGSEYMKQIIVAYGK